MSVIMYLASLVISFSTLCLTIWLMFADAESRLANMVGDIEIFFLIGVAVVLMCVGFGLEKECD